MNTFDTFESKFDFAKFMIRVSDQSVQMGIMVNCTIKGKVFTVLPGFIVGPYGYMVPPPMTQTEAIEYLTNL